MYIITETLDPVIIPPRYLHYRLSKSLSVLNAQLLVSGPLHHVHICIHPTHHTSHIYIHSYKIAARLCYYYLRQLFISRPLCMLTPPRPLTGTYSYLFTYLLTPMHAANICRSYASYNLSAPRLPPGLAFSSALHAIGKRGVWFPGMRTILHKSWLHKARGSCLCHPSPLWHAQTRPGSQCSDYCLAARMHL